MMCIAGSAQAGFNVVNDPNEKPLVLEKDNLKCLTPGTYKGRCKVGPEDHMYLRTKNKNLYYCMKEHVFNQRCRRNIQKQRPRAKKRNKKKAATTQKAKNKKAKAKEFVVVTENVTAKCKCKSKCECSCECRKAYSEMQLTVKSLQAKLKKVKWQLAMTKKKVVAREVAFGVLGTKYANLTWQFNMMGKKVWGLKEALRKEKAKNKELKKYKKLVKVLKKAFQQLLQAD